MTERFRVHDDSIITMQIMAESLGYEITEMHLEEERGPDLLISNPFNGKQVIIESEVGHDTVKKILVNKAESVAQRIRDGKVKALIIITNTPERIREEPGYCPDGLQLGQNFFVVASTLFKEVLSALLVKILE